MVHNCLTLSAQEKLEKLQTRGGVLFAKKDSLEARVVQASCESGVYLDVDFCCGVAIRTPEPRRTLGRGSLGLLSAWFHLF